MNQLEYQAKNFEDIKRANEFGNKYQTAIELQIVLEYA